MLFIGILVFLVFIYWRPQDFIEGLSTFRPILLIMSLTGFLWFMKKLKVKDFNRTAIIPLDYAILGYFFAICLSTYNFHWMRYSFDTFIDFSKVVIFYFLIAECVNTKERVRIFTLLLSFLTFLIASIAALQRFGIDIFGVGMVLGRVQGVGIYQNPNYLAYSIAMVVPLQFYIFKQEKFVPWKMVHLMFLITSYVCIFFTKSRGGLLCIIGTSVFILAQRKKMIVKYLVLGSGILLLMFVLSAGPRFQSLNKDDGTIQDRIQAWYGGITMLKAHPLTGVGVGLFNEYHKGKTAHSSFVLTGSETGLIGLFMWVAIVFFSMKALHKVNIRSGTSQYSMALEASMVGYIICSFFATFSYRITFFILCGLIAAVKRIDLYDKIRLSMSDDSSSLDLKSDLSVKKIDFVAIIVFEFFLILVWHAVIKNRF